MDLGVIAPISFMEEVAKLSKTSMYLYHLFDNSKYEDKYDCDT